MGASGFFKSWIETYFELVLYILKHLQNDAIKKEPRSATGYGQNPIP